MNMHKTRRVAALERWLAPRLSADTQLGAKLAEVFVDLVSISIAIFAINLATIRLCGVVGTAFWVAQIPWTIVMFGVWWRCFLQYVPFIDPNAFVCIDGRLKRGHERSKVDFGPVKVCLTCETSRIEAMQTIGAYRERIAPVCERQGLVKNL